MSKIKTDLPMGEPLEASEEPETEVKMAYDDGASVAELMERIRMMQARNADLQEAADRFQAQRRRRLH